MNPTEPNQRSIDAVLAGVDRVRVVPFANYVQGRPPQPILIDTAERAALAAFRTCFAIVEDPSTFGHCMCPGDPFIELHAGQRVVATLSYHHGVSIRWDAWTYDAVLAEPDKLLDWMSAHGAPGPRAAVEEARRRAEDSERSSQRWLAAMPVPLRPFWDQLDPFPDAERYQPSLAALAAALPNTADQILALLAWFGSGAGRWSGYPSHESVAEQLLLRFPPTAIADALTAPTPAQLVGASRLFAGWHFSQQHGHRGLAALTPALKKQLLAAAEGTGIDDNVSRASTVFR
jgi:hypothetical protein